MNYWLASNLSTIVPQLRISPHRQSPSSWWWWWSWWSCWCCQHEAQNVVKWCLMILWGLGKSWALVVNPMTPSKMRQNTVEACKHPKTHVWRCYIFRNKLTTNFVPNKFYKFYVMSEFPEFCFYICYWFYLWFSEVGSNRWNWEINFLGQVLFPPPPQTWARSATKQCALYSDNIDSKSETWSLQQSEAFIVFGYYSAWLHITLKFATIS